MRAFVVGGAMRYPTAILALSIVAIPLLVNAGSKGLSTVNPPSPAAELKDSVSDTKSEFGRLVEYVLTHGEEDPFGPNIGRIVGFAGAVPAKTSDVIKVKGVKGADLACSVVYETDPSDSRVKRPVSLFVFRQKRMAGKRENRYFRVALDGQLEKAVYTQIGLDKAGNVISGTAAKYDQEIDSQETKKSFDSEMRQVRAWFKKQLKQATAKRSTASATPIAGSPVAATP